MKIEKLNENKIRITLNIEDLNERNIDTHSFMSNSIETQNIFFDMLVKADEEVGFNTDDCRIMIEAIALKDGRFVLTITKYEHSKPTKAKEETDLTQKKKSLHIKRKKPTFNSLKTIYCFDSFDAFCELCTFLEKSTNLDVIINLTQDSALYLYNSNYYLIFTAKDGSSQALSSVSPILAEFARYVNNADLFERMVLEYGKPIMKKDAIKICIKHFV